MVGVRLIFSEMARYVVGSVKHYFKCKGKQINRDHSNEVRSACGTGLTQRSV